MTISLELSPQTQQRLETLASKHGQPLEAYVSALLEKTAPPIDAPPAPLQEDFSGSGMSEEERTNLAGEELKAVRKTEIERFRKRGLKGVGMFAHIPGGSEEFAKSKQEEIDCEDRSRL